MPTQKRETGKNYIGLLSDESEEQCAAEVRAGNDRRVTAYVLGLMAAMFNSRRNEARQLPSPRPQRAAGFEAGAANIELRRQTHISTSRSKRRLPLR